MNRINYYLIIIIGIVSTLNYAPFIPINTSIITDILFVILSINNISVILKKIKSKVKIICIIFIILFYYAIIYILKSDIYTIDLYAIILSFILFLVFSSIDYSFDDRRKVLNIISFTIIIVTIFSFIYYYKTLLTTTNYVEGQYYFEGKNGLGPMVSFAGFWFLYSTKINKKKYLTFFIFIISLILLSAIKARTSLLALIIASIIFILKNIKINKYKNIIIFIFLLILLIPLYSYIKDYLFSAFNIDYINQSVNGYIGKEKYLDIILSGRLDHYKYGLYLFANNPLFGTSFEPYKISEVIGNTFGIHSFIIRSLGYGGFFYFIIIISLIFSYIRYFKNNGNKNSMVNYILIMGGIGMFFEPIAPFGPGTSYLLFWLMLGLDIKNNLNKEKDI